MENELDRHIELCLKLKEHYPWATNYNCLATYILQKRMNHGIIAKMFYKVYDPKEYPLEKELDMLDHLFELNWVTDKEFDGRRNKHNRV